MQTIGLIGVGRVGTEIAKLLLGGGYRVLGYRRSSLGEFEKIGGTPARSPAQIGEEADIVLSCLPGGNSLDEVVNGPNGLVHTVKKGQIVAELGSHPLPAKERQVERLRAKGAVFLDGEVSGTPGMVAARKAPIYLAGDAEACKTLEPIIKAFADIYLYLGAFGAASKIKFVNNLLVTINTAAIGEAVSLALKAGVDPELDDQGDHQRQRRIGPVPDPGAPHGAKELSPGAGNVRDALPLFRVYRRSRGAGRRTHPTVRSRCAALSAGHRARPRRARCGGHHRGDR